MGREPKGLGFAGKSPARELPDGLDRNLAELNAFSFKAIVGLLIRRSRIRILPGAPFSL